MGSEARTVTADNAAEVATWCQGQLVAEKDCVNEKDIQPAINLMCGAEVKRARVGDIIIHNSDGSFDVRNFW